MLIKEYNFEGAQKIANKIYSSQKDPKFLLESILFNFLDSLNLEKADPNKFKQSLNLQNLFIKKLFAELNIDGNKPLEGCKNVQ